MKVKVLSLLVPALLVAGAANAAEVYNKDGKWYGVIMNLPRATLGLAGKGDVEVVNLKCDHVLDVLLNSEPGAVLPAYHMNKKHWLTIVLDGKFPAGELYGLIDESHGLTR